MPAPPPPPPPNFNASNSGSGDQGRGMLLQSIRAGKTLKKTVTVDKSAPAISGRVRGEPGNAQVGNSNGFGSSSTNGNNSNNNGGPVGLGGLFSGGIPKLKPTGLRANFGERDNNVATGNTGAHNTSNAPTPSVRRGPPPIPPPATQKPQIFPQAQSVTDSPLGNIETSKPPGKPMLAPKPPPPPFAAPQKPSPPPKKLNLTGVGGSNVTRAQSMRLPRSPPVLAPIPSTLHQSQDCLNETQQKPMGRILRPPIARPPSPPSRAPPTITRAAPPPPSRVTVTAPSIPPPPPPLPHRSAPTHQRLAPPPPLPPTPPTRGSSMRNGQSTPTLDFEVRFAEMFHSILNFPPPEPFRGLPKIYSSKNAAKQQAPAPPPPPTTSTPSSMLQMNTATGGKQWQRNTASSAC